MSETRSPESDREIVMDMLFEIVSDLLPEDNKEVPQEIEKKIITLYHALSYALKIKPGESM